MTLYGDFIAQKRPINKLFRKKTAKCLAVRKKMTTFAPAKQDGACSSVG